MATEINPKEDWKNIRAILNKISELLICYDFKGDISIKDYCVAYEIRARNSVIGEASFTISGDNIRCRGVKTDRIVDIKSPGCFDEIERFIKEDNDRIGLNIITKLLFIRSGKNEHDIEKVREAVTKVEEALKALSNNTGKTDEDYNEIISFEDNELDELLKQLVSRPRKPRRAPHPF